MSGSLTNYSESKILDHIFGAIPFGVMPLLYFGYMVGLATEDGAGAEPNSGNYQRVGVANNTTNFPLTSNQVKQNATEIVFPEATANHGLVQSIGIWDAPVSGNLLAYMLLPEPVQITVGDAMRLPIGAFTHQFNAGGGFSNFVKNSILNHVYGGVPFNIIPLLHFGYMSTAPTDANAGTEPSAGGYARTAVTNNANMFPSTVNGSKRNAMDILFGEATGAQGAIAHVGIWSAATGGNFIGFYQLPSVQSVGVGIAPRIPSNTVTLTLN